MITISINVLLLEKSRFKEFTLRNGKKALYCDLVLIETPNGQYGDFMVKQSVTKEERAAKKDMPILGNGKDWNKGGARTASAAPSEGATEPSPIPGDDDVPF